MKKFINLFYPPKSCIYYLNSGWNNVINSGKIIDSRSFLSILKNEKAPGRSWLFSETFDSPPTENDGKTARNSDYHLLRFDNGKDEFYKLSTDVEEKTNLLLKPQNMTNTDRLNYDLLCDSISTLTSTAKCNFLEVNNVENKEAFKLYPNPTKGIIQIELNYIHNPVFLELVDLNGRIIFTGTIYANIYQLDLSKNNSGIYFCKIKSDSNSSIIKIIKDFN